MGRSSARTRGPAALGAVLALIVVIAAGCTLPGSAAGADSSSDGYVLRIGATSVTGTPAGSLGWADKNGILADKLAPAGVTKIEYAFFQSGKDVVAALLSGAVDVAAVGDNPTLTAKGNGAAVTLLALDSINGDTWLIGAKGGPTSIDGLAGKSITAPQGTIRDRAARQLVAEAGLTGKIEIKDVPTPESIAGLTAGKIDATVVGGTGAVELANKGFPVIDKTSAHGLGSVGTTIAQSAFVEAHPGFVEAWQAGVVATNVHIVEHLDDYIAWVAETDAVDPELVRQSIDPKTFNTEPLPKVGLDQLNSAYEFLRDDDAITQEFDVYAWAGQSA
ncbi:ABC transporter substrate-binding protein [Microlunatus sp. GCM10028923]|uniref:ABC transporter substrate-binding protein n=1 Tax=Microlunatus sp. GCM10028923 TaxID=3273400 RepID=UPI0036725F40